MRSEAEYLGQRLVQPQPHKENVSNCNSPRQTALFPRSKSLLWGCRSAPCWAFVFHCSRGGHIPPTSAYPLARWEFFFSAPTNADISHPIKVELLRHFFSLFSGGMLSFKHFTSPWVIITKAITPQRFSGHAKFENFRRSREKFLNFRMSRVVRGSQRSGEACAARACPKNVVQDAQRSGVSWTTYLYANKIPHLTYFYKKDHQMDYGLFAAFVG
ncbi:hypothetical protein [Lewinella sp. LCG006]|uniref:hypothetical protein n=1 Tax=Lewinella sp. LCG006 TaxID=3231911 RepID=UPI003461756A